jgi:hypothetical protein
VRGFALGVLIGAALHYISEYFRPLMDWEAELFEKTADLRDRWDGNG